MNDNDLNGPGETASPPGPKVAGHSPRRPVVLVIDGQGGGFGVAIIKELRASFGDALEIWALGANSTATAAMMKAKANRGATGENAVRVSAARADAVMGPIAVTWANAMMGEITPGLAAAVTSAPAPKILIPLSQEGVTLAGFKSEPLPHLVSEAIRQLALIACGH
ncbi:MAG: DUF3842 family protein [Candidatus Adiutrix sp.]|jgi:hypothetical protein|nr:DUF3842 family protein [Candidatus Adiutrix sp.]